MNKLICGMAMALLIAAAHAATAGGAIDKGPIAPKTSFSTDFSDLWWNPSESGWGAQLVQQSNVIFATLFIYAPDGTPTWATAQMNFAGGVTFSGPLYLTSGPWFGAGVFNPNAVGVRQAGTMTFTPQNVGEGVLSYSIDGVPVTKQIQRQTLVFEDFNGTYAIEGNFQATGCFNPLGNRVVAGTFAVTISQTSSTMSMIWVFPDGSACTYSGLYSQRGRLGQFDGNYSCTTGEVGQMTLFEMGNRPGIINGRAVGASTNLGCQYRGYFAGLDPNHPPR